MPWSLPKEKTIFMCLILPCVVGIATAGLIFQFIHFLPSIEDQAARYLLQTSCIGFYLMCFYSYYQTIMITCNVPPSIILPRVKHQIEGNHPFYVEKNICDKQNMRYKPPRTSHCHVCKCVARMDHHCPYTNCCIGANNFKSFMLFCFYGGLFALQFITLSFSFYFKILAGKASLSQNEVIFWIFLNLFGGLLSLSMNGLWISNLVMACKNITQMDLLKGNFKFQDKLETHPNPFDIGVFSNINSIFNGDNWLFWWPSEIINDKDATQFPMKPPIFISELKDLPQKIQQQLNNFKNIPKTIEELKQKQSTSYEKVVFHYKNQQYSIDQNLKKSNLFDLNLLEQGLEILDFSQSASGIEQIHPKDQQQNILSLSTENISHI